MCMPAAERFNMDPAIDKISKIHRSLMRLHGNALCITGADHWRRLEPFCVLHRKSGWTNKWHHGIRESRRGHSFFTLANHLVLEWSRTFGTVFGLQTMMKTTSQEMMVNIILPKVIQACKAGLIPIYNPEICAAVEEDDVGPLGNVYLPRHTDPRRRNRQADG